MSNTYRSALLFVLSATATLMGFILFVAGSVDIALFGAIKTFSIARDWGIGLMGVGIIAIGIMLITGKLKEVF